MIVVDNVIQGDADWHRLRAGVLTASAASEVLTPGRKLSKQRTKLVCRLAAERILGRPVEDFGGNFWTERGNELEHEAADYFAFVKDVQPQAVGFVFRNEMRNCGCSPDWLMKDADGEWFAGAEVKSPAAETHMEALCIGEAKKHDPQIQFSLWVTGLPIWYFVSYYPGLPEVIQPVEPDPDWQTAFDLHVPKVIAEVKAIVEKHGNIKAVDQRRQELQV